MSSPVADEVEQPEEDSFVWRITKPNPDTGKVDVALSEQFADLSDSEMTYFMHRLGETLIKLGTQFLQSRVGDDEYDDD